MAASRASGMMSPRARGAKRGAKDLKVKATAKVTIPASMKGGGFGKPQVAAKAKRG